MMNNKMKLAVGVALLGLSAGANAAVIDLFSTSQAQMTDSTLFDGGLSSSVVGADILGGERDLSVELLSLSPFNPDGTASVGVAGGALSFSTDSLTTGTGTVQWDGADNSMNLVETGLQIAGVGVDLTGGGMLTGFGVTTVFSDGDYEFVVNAFTDATHWTSISFQAHATAVPATSYIPFAAFTNPGLCGAVNPAPDVNSITCAPGNLVVDFTNVGALELVIDPLGSTVSVDLTLDQVTSIPEPSVLGLMGAGLLAGGLVARRRKTKTA